MVLRAVLRAVEGLDPLDFDSGQALRNELMEAVRTAASPFTDLKEPIALKAMADERRTMEIALASVSEVDLQAVQPFPRRRRLQDEDSRQIVSQLQDRWDADPSSYWYPLSVGRPADVEASQAPWVLHAIPLGSMRQMLRARNIDRVWEIRERGATWEIDLALFEPVYDGDERYWSAGSFDWIVYASHESSLTIGGWLLGEVKAVWADWASHVYEAWEFDWPSPSDA